MHPWPGNCVAIEYAVMYCAWSAHASSAVIECWPCISEQSFIPFEVFTINMSLAPVHSKTSVTVD